MSTLNWRSTTLSKDSKALLCGNSQENYLTKDVENKKTNYQNDNNNNNINTTKDVDYVFFCKDMIKILHNLRQISVDFI